VGAHRAQSAEQSITDALLEARMLPQVAQFALPALLKASQLEQNERGEVIAITYEGERFAEPTKAAAKFLAAHPYFAKPAIGGSGSRPSIGVPNQMPKRDITKMDGPTLIAEGMKQPVGG
jgi:hypothetical protein